MTVVSNLQMIDSHGDILTCKEPGHSRDIKHALNRHLSQKINAFYKKFKTSGLVKESFAKAKDVDVKLYTNAQDQVTITLTSLQGTSTTKKLDTAKHTSLEKEAREIIRTIQDIWAQHTHSHPPEHVPAPIPHGERHSYRGHNTSHTRHKASHPHIEHAASHTPKADPRKMERKTSSAVLPLFKENERIEKACSKAIKYMGAANRVLRDYRQDKPVIESAVSLVENISEHIDGMRQLVATMSAHHPSRADLNELIIDLTQKLETLKSISSSQEDPQLFADIYNTLLPIANAMSLANDKQTPADLLRELSEAINTLKTTYEGNAHVIQCIDSIQRITYFYAHSLFPSLRFTKGPLQHREGEWLFNNFEAAGNEFDNHLRGLALKFSLVHHLAIGLQSMTTDNAVIYRKLFEALPQTDQNAILLKFAEVKGLSIRENKDIQKTIRACRLDFFGDPKSSTPTIQARYSFQRAEALNHWIRESLNQIHGNLQRHLIQDHETFRETLTALESHYTSLNDQLVGAREAESQAKEKATSLEQQLLALTEDRASIKSELQQLRIHAEAATREALEAKTLLLAGKDEHAEAVRRLEAQVLESQQSSAGLRGQIDALTAELQTKAQAHQATSEELVRLQTLEETATAQASSAQRKLESSLTAKDSTIDALQNKVADKKNVVKQLKAQVSALEEQLRKKHSADKTTAENLKRASAELKNLQQRLDVATKEVKASQELLSTKTREHTQIVDSLKAQVLEGAGTATQLRSQITALEKQFQENITAHQHTSARLEELEALQASTVAASDSTQQEFLKLQASLERQAITLRALELQVSEKDTLAAQCKAHADALEATLQEKTLAHQATHEELNLATQQAQQFRDQADLAARQKEEAQQELSLKTTEHAQAIHLLQAQVDEKEETAASLRTQVDDLISELEQLRSLQTITVEEARSAKEALLALQVSSKEQADTIRALELQVSEKETLSAQLKERVDTLEATLLEKTSAHQATHEELVRLQSLQEKTTEQVASTQRKLHELKSSLTAKDSTIATLHDQVAHKEKAVKQLKTQVSTLEEQLRKKHSADKTSAENLKHASAELKKLREHADAATHDAKEAKRLLSTRTDEHAQAVKKLEAQVFEGRQTAMQLQSQIEDCQAELQQSQSNHQTASDQLEELRALQAQTSEEARTAKEALLTLQTSSQAQADAIRALELQVSEKDALAAQFKERADTLEATLLEKTSAHQATHEELTLATQQAQQFRDQADLAARQTEEAQQELSSKTSEYAQAIHLLQAQVATKEEASASLRTQVDDLASELTQARVLQQSTSEELEQLRSLQAVAAEEALSAKEELLALQASSKEQADTIRTFELQVSEKDALAAQFKERADALEATLLEKISAHQTTVEELAEATKHIEQLRQLAATTTSDAERTKLLASKQTEEQARAVHLLESRVAEKERAAADLETLVAHLTSELEKTKATQQSTSAELERLRSLQATTAKEAHTAKQQLRDVETSLQTNIDAIRALEIQVSEKDTLAEQLKERADASEATLQEKTLAHQVTQEELRVATLELHQLREHADAADHNAQLAQERLLELQASLEEQTAAILKATNGDTRHPSIIIQELRARIDAQAHQYSTAQLSHQQELLAKASEIEQLQKAIELTESTYAEQQARCRKAEALTAATAKELEEARSHMEQLRLQAEALSRVEEIATTTIATQTRAEDIESAASSLATRSITPVSIADTELAPEPSIFKIDAAAFGKLSRAVQQGHLEMLLSPQDAPTLEHAPDALFTYLSTYPDQVNEIYHLAIFIAHARPDAFRDQALSHLLQSWIVNRGLKAPVEKEKEKINTLLVTLTGENQASGQVLREAVLKGVALAKFLKDGRSKNHSQSWQWGHTLLTKPNKSRLETYLAKRLSQKLSAIQGTIVDPESSTTGLTGVTTPIGAESQLLKDIRSNEWDRGSNHRWAYLGAVKESGRTLWQLSAQTQEESILQAIAEIARLDDMDPTIPLDLDVSHLEIPKIGLPSCKLLKTIEAAGPTEIAKHLHQKTVIVGLLKAEVVGRIASLTGLQPKDATTASKTLFEQALASKLPNVLHSLLLQGHQEEFLTLSKLLYWQSAFDRWTDPSNEKAQQSKFAPPQAWAWLAEALSPGTEIDPVQFGKLLLILTHSFRQHPDLTGSPLAPYQVQWAQTLHSLYISGKPGVIYDEAGAGKTVTANFCLQLFKRLYPSIDKSVHWLSPFSTDIPGMHSVQLKKFSGDITIEATTANDIVLVDEAHKLVPENRDLDDENSRVRILLCHGKDRIPVQWLQMTATPVIPAIPQAMQSTFDQTTSREYTEALAHIQERMQTLEEAHQAHLSYIQTRYHRYTIQQHIDTLKSQPLLTELQRTYTTLHASDRGRRKLYPIKPEFLVATIRDTICGELHGSLQRQLGSAGPLAISVRAKEALQETIDYLVHSQARSGKQELQIVIEHLQSLKTAFSRQEDALPQPALTDYPLFLSSKVTTDREILEIAQQLHPLRELAKYYANKTTKYAQKASSPLSEDQQFALALPAKRNAHLSKIRYQTAPASVFPASSNTDTMALDTGLKMGLSQLKVEPQTLQLVFPNVRFTSENFDLLVSRTVTALKTRKKQPIRVLYQDSHSTNGDLGKKWMLIFDDKSPTGRKVLLDKAALLEEKQRQTAGKKNPYLDVLLYDMTNQQGGDFGAFSLSHTTHEIDQIIFYQFNDRADRSPTDLTTANDSYQALRRRRERTPASRTPIVLGDVDTHEHFVQKLQQHQTFAEQFYASTTAAAIIARRYLKQVALIHGVYTKENKSERALQQIAVQHLPALQSVDIVDETRIEMITGKQRPVVEALRRYIAMGRESLEADTTNPTRGLVLARLHRIDDKMLFHRKWVASVAQPE
ncbi:MAG: hypothetical protein KGZ39_04750 [Simkania sp.]|nr:hypothetical protein [Simkania sp.]